MCRRCLFRDCTLPVVTRVVPLASPAGIRRLVAATVPVPRPVQNQRDVHRTSGSSSRWAGPASGYRVRCRARVRHRVLRRRSNRPGISRHETARRYQARSRSPVQLCCYPCVLASLLHAAEKRLGHAHLRTLRTGSTWGVAGVIRQVGMQCAGARAGVRSGGMERGILSPLLSSEVRVRFCPEAAVYCRGDAAGIASGNPHQAAEQKDG